MFDEEYRLCVIRKLLLLAVSSTGLTGFGVLELLIYNLENKKECFTKQSLIENINNGIFLISIFQKTIQTQKILH